MKVKERELRGERGSAQSRRERQRVKKDREWKRPVGLQYTRCHRGLSHRLAPWEPGRGPISIETLTKLQEEQDTEAYSY